MHVTASCDVPFYRDGEAEGCSFENENTAYGNFVVIADGTYNAGCTADLTLAITAGAYFGANSTTSSPEQQPTNGVAVRVAVVEVPRAEVEWLAATVFVPSPNLPMPPTLDQMLVPGSEAAVLPASLFTSEQ